MRIGRYPFGVLHEYLLLAAYLSSILPACNLNLLEELRFLLLNAVNELERE